MTPAAEAAVITEMETMKFEQAVPEYKAPEIQTLRDQEVLEAMGPAQAYTGNLPFGF
jgi:hypothetical protein